MHRATRVLFLALLPAVFGCSATGSRRTSYDDLEGSVAGIAQQLVRTTELRLDLSTARVGVYGIEPAHVDPSVGYPARQVSDVFGKLSAELEYEFTLALAGRMYLVDVGLAQREGAPADGDLAQLTAQHGATHALIGEYLRRDEELVVAVRLVEAKSLLIVGTARGSLPVGQLSESSQIALRAWPQATSTFRAVALPPVTSGAAVEPRNQQGAYWQANPEVAPEAVQNTEPLAVSSTRYRRAQELAPPDPSALEPADPAPIEPAPVETSSTPLADAPALVGEVAEAETAPPGGPAARRLGKLGRKLDPR